MKRSKRRASKANALGQSRISPEEAVEFLEAMRVMAGEIDEPTVPISLRVPANILRIVKLRAKADGKKYQSLIVEYIRKGIQGRNND